MSRPQLRKSLILLSLLFPLLFPKPARAYMWQGLEIIPRASLLEVFDDNVSYSDNDPDSDFITRLLLGVTVKAESPTHTLSGDFNIRQNLYADDSSLNNTAQELAFRLEKEVTKYDRIHLSDSFSHSEDPINFEDAFGRTNGRYSTYRNLLAADYRHDLNEQLALEFRYSNDATSISRDDLTDSVMNTLGTGLDYTLGPSTILKTNYDYRKRDYDPGSSSTENELSLGVRRFLTEQLYLDVSAGANVIDSADGDSETQPVFRAALTTDVDQTTQTGIAFEKRYTTTAYSAETFDMWKFSAKVARQLTDRIQGVFGGFYGEGTYLTSDIEEKLAGVNLGSNYALTENSMLNLNYDFTNNDSEGTNSYQKNVVSLGVTVDF